MRPRESRLRTGFPGECRDTDRRSCSTIQSERTAAVAAKAAITALSEDTCDSNGKIADDCANDDADFAPGGRQQALLTFKRKKGSAPTSEGKKKRRQEATDKSTDENALNKPVQAVENPSLFDRVSSSLSFRRKLSMSTVSMSLSDICLVIPL